MPGFKGYISGENKTWFMPQKRSDKLFYLQFKYLFIRLLLSWLNYPNIVPFIWCYIFHAEFTAYTLLACRSWEPELSMVSDPPILSPKNGRFFPANISQSFRGCRLQEQGLDTASEIEAWSPLSAGSSPPSRPPTFQVYMILELESKTSLHPTTGKP